MKLTPDKLEQLINMEMAGELDYLSITIIPGRKRRKSHKPLPKIEVAYLKSETPHVSTDNEEERKHGCEILNNLSKEISGKRVIQGTIRKETGRWYLNYSTKGA